MVLGKRTREHSTDSKPISSSPLSIIHDDDDDVSGVEAMLRRRKQPKTTPVSSPSSNNKMAWTKDDELIILGSIVDYEKETKLSHRSDWDAFYGYVKDFIEAEFSKKQLVDKIRNLNRRFLGNKARCGDEEGPSFTSTEDDEIFKLSMIIWDTREETECGSDENVGQAKDVTCVEHERVDENMDQSKLDAPSVEHEKVSEHMDQAKGVACVEHERVDENVEQETDAPSVEHERDNVDENMEQEKVRELNKDAPLVEHERVNADTDQEMDVPCEEHEGVDENMDREKTIPCTEDEPVRDARSIETDKGEKEKSKEDGLNEFCALQDALTDREENESNEEEDGVDEICALKNALTDKEEKENNEEDGEDEYCALKDALEATTFFQSIGRYQQKVLLRNLKTIGGPRRKELADELKELIDEEMKLYAKKLSLSAKLANAWEESSC